MRIVSRAIVPAMLVAVGLAGIVYGVCFHTEPVCIEKQRQVMTPAYERGRWGEPPTVKMEKATEKYLEPRDEPEWILVRDLSVGGLKRLYDGQLKRTYSGKPPSLCPT